MGITSGKGKPSVSGKSSKSKECKVPNTSVFFNFQYIISDKDYGIDSLTSKKGAYKDLIKAIHRYSQSSWEELQKKRKENGGFETLDYGIMKPLIASMIKDKPLTKDTKLYVFRFGGTKYRMIGYKSNTCKAAMHILGFDTDFTLYKHS